MPAPSPGLALRFFVSGQSRIYCGLRGVAHEAFLALADRIRQADAAFTNYENCICPPVGQEAGGGHPADECTLADLKWLGFNLLALANNHAAEGGPGGMARTKELARELGFCSAGTGRTLAEATAPGFLAAAGGRVALVSSDTANVQTRKAVAGEGGGWGVNPLRRANAEGETVRLREDDVARNVRAVEEAAEQSDWVFVSVHEHLWPEDRKSVLPWKRDFARALVDAGASAVLCHGIPRACAVEIYRKAPIFHSLGNFIFHPTGDQWRDEEIWEGFVADGVFGARGAERMRLTPIVLADAEGRTDVPQKTRICPMLAQGCKAREILERVAAESAPLGTVVEIAGEEGFVKQA